MKTRKIIIVAKCFDSSVSGPANIVRGLIKGFEEENIPYKAILLKEGIYKKEFLNNLIHSLKTEKNAIVNVHTDGFLIPLIVYILSFFFRNHSYYLTVHGIYQIESSMNKTQKKKYILLEKIIYCHFPNLICVSKMLKNNIEDIYKRNKNIIVIPNATDAESNLKYQKKDCLELVSLGGLRKRKGIDTIINLATSMRNNSIKIHISLYGANENNVEWFNGEVKKRKLQDMLKYCGNISSKQEIYDTIKKADAQLCLSLYDSYNVAIAESLVLGCPCIATEMCGASYLIKDGINGIVINSKEKNQNIYIKVMTYIYSLDIEKRKMIEEMTKLYKSELSWSNIVHCYAELQ